MKNEKLFNIAGKMETAIVEKDVENNYRQAFSFYYNDQNIEITSPFSCDGFLKFNEIQNQNYVFNFVYGDYDNNELRKPRILFEFKYDQNYQKKFSQAESIIQAIFYLKRFEIEQNDGKNFPNVIFIGDKNECFFLHSNKVLKYLDKKINWNIAPSEAKNLYKDIVLEISNDESINPFPFILSNEDFYEITQRILDESKNVKQHIRITEHNLNRIFSQFDSNVLLENDIEPEERVSIFIGCIIDQNSFYIHPKKKNTLVTPKRPNGVKVNLKKFHSFFSYFKGENYDISEKRKFTEIQDRLIDELHRRKSGEYFTPTLWTDEAHKMISKTFGEKWKQKYIVWDCSCGTKNLTRDYSFSNLYLSTLFQSDLDISKNYNISHNTTSFQYDFLNDDVSFNNTDMFIKHFKLPQKLIQDLIEKKPIIFFINPPYGTANADGAKGDGSKKKGMALTEVNKIMKKEKLGNSSHQLFAQFLYKILMIKKIFSHNDINICVFANPIFLSGSGFKKFRKLFLDNFKFKNAMLFCANNFSDVSSDWGISFSIWESGETLNKKCFSHTLKEETMFGIDIIGEKKIYNTDYSISCSDWAKKDIYKKYKKNEFIDYPQLTSPLNTKQNGIGKFIPGALGFYNNIANNIYQSEGGVGIFSASYAAGHGYPIMSEYFDDIIINFVARRLAFSEENWKNQKDEFLKPNIEHNEYSLFKEDAYILTIFNPKCKVSSLRGLKYKEKKWDILNHFFYMSTQEIKRLAQKYNNEIVFSDLIQFSEERFLYKKIEIEKMSKLSLEVYEKACELTKKTFQFREILNEDYPEYNLCSWDAGWYQVKFIAQKTLKDEYIEFEKSYKRLFNYWKPYIYTFKFLIK